MIKRKDMRRAGALALNNGCAHIPTQERLEKRQTGDFYIQLATFMGISSIWGKKAGKSCTIRTRNRAFETEEGHCEGRFAATMKELQSLSGPHTQSVH